MKNFLLTIGAIYGIGMSLYGVDWYLKDIKQLETAVQIGNKHVEIRHRINTWGNVSTILLANLITVSAIAGISSRCPCLPSFQKDED